MATKYSTGSSASSLTNSLSSSAVSTGWTTTGLTVNNGGYYVSDLSLNTYDMDTFLTLYVTTTQEPELKEALARIKKAIIIKDGGSTDDPSRTWKTIVIRLISARHFTEDFLMEFIDLFDDKNVRDAILIHHAADIYSDSYSKIALKFVIGK